MHFALNSWLLWLLFSLQTSEMHEGVLTMVNATVDAHRVSHQ